MRNRTLASALTLLLSGGIAVADETETESVTVTETETTSEPRMNQPADNIQNVDLFFNTASAELTQAATSDLQKLADWAKCSSSNAIILEGHADPRGSADFNLKLSGERAAAVRQQLIDMGVPSERIVVSVYGENGPRQPTLAEDRRVTARASDAPVTPSDLAG
jgi:outer membrane protein OmpA-like peptidoglycan-associated protein